LFYFIIFVNFFLSGFWGVISIKTGTCTLLMPRHFPDYAVWCGEVKPPSHFRDHYDVENGRFRLLTIAIAIAIVIVIAIAIAIASAIAISACCCLLF
jgi:hypothetical protein